MRFEDYKQRKERGYSVKQAIQDATANVDEYEGIVIVAKKKDGGITMCYSGESDGELIGLMEVAKDVMIEDIRDRL